MCRSASSRQLLAAYLLAALLQCAVFPNYSHAQIGGSWNGFDTVTAGDFDDLNPSIVCRNFDYSFSYDDEFLWVVFERHTLIESQIIVKKLRKIDGAWDSSEVLLSAVPSGEDQKYPDIAQSPYLATPPAFSLQKLVAWQRWKDNRWQLFYTTLRSNDVTWSVPSLLVVDSLSNTGVQVRWLTDSVFIVTWKRASALIALFLTPFTISRAETVAISSSDSFSYDIMTGSGPNLGTIVWTSESGTGEMILCRTISTGSLIRFSEPETTLTVSSPGSNPHLVASYFDLEFIYEEETGSPKDVFFYSRPVWPYSGNISEDPLSEDCNARAFRPPVITKVSPSRVASFPGYGACVYTKYRGADSVLVFFSYGTSDTVRSRGHNRNPRICSQMIWLQPYMNVLVVWESNRSGRSHIYSRLLPIDVGDVRGPAQQPESFTLLQNYPNPFNPATTISYQLSAAGDVRLEVFDPLGREISLLVNTRQGPGRQSVVFSGTSLSSGVYYYRLRTDDRVAVRQMLLLK